jgi:uncharacterized membrane protein
MLSPTFILNLSVGLTLLSYACWGVFDKKALERAKPQQVMLGLFLIRLINFPVTLTLLFTLLPGWHLSWNLMFWTFCACMSSFISTQAYTIAMSKLEASYVLGVTSCYCVVFQFLAMLWLGEPVVRERLIGAAIITVGVAVVGASKCASKPFPKGRELAVAIVSLVLATFFWGCTGIFDKRAVCIGHPFEVSLSASLCDLVFLTGLLLYNRGVGLSLPSLNAHMWKFCFFSTLAWLIGNYSYYFAFTTGSASYVIAIISAYPLVMYLLAMLILKESLNRQRLCGMALVSIGSILVQLTQSTI